MHVCSYVYMYLHVCDVHGSMVVWILEMPFCEICQVMTKFVRLCVCIYWHVCTRGCIHTVYGCVVACGGL